MVSTVKKLISATPAVQPEHTESLIHTLHIFNRPTGAHFKYSVIRDLLLK